MFQLGVCSVLFRIGIEMGWSIHFDSNGSILSSGYIAILVGQRATKFARELLDDGVFLLFFLLQNQKRLLERMNRNLMT